MKKNLTVKEIILCQLAIEYCINLFELDIDKEITLNDRTFKRIK